MPAIRNSAARRGSELAKQGGAVKVWDLPVRLFHWSLAVLVAFSWWSGTRGGHWLPLHERSGYAIFTLLLFRVLWGIAGSDSARFTGFVRGPRIALTYLRSIAARHPPHYLGHNPLGGWMVLALLASLFVQGATGLFATDDVAFSGPLAHDVREHTRELVTALHKLNFDLLLGLVALHVVAVLAHTALRRDGLLAAMFTGHKPAPSGAPALRFASPARAALLLALAALLVWSIARLG